MNLSRCISCGSENLKHEARSVRFEYRGELLEIPELTGWFCNDCGDAELDPGFNQLYFQKISSFKNSTDIKLQS